MPRILIARFMHETNTFSRVKTDMALIRRRDFHLENEIPQAFRGTRSALGATFEAADKYGWSLVHPVSANPNPSGIVTDDAFEQIVGMILEAADRKGSIDGALLHLHGAMVTEAHEDAEGELLARLRQKLGSRTPIVVTLDLHANVTRKMADNANALIAFRTYPHIDMYERAWQEAELLGALKHIQRRSAATGSAASPSPTPSLSDTLAHPCFTAHQDLRAFSRDPPRAPRFSPYAAMLRVQRTRARALRGRAPARARRLFPAQAYRRASPWSRSERRYEALASSSSGATGRARTTARTGSCSSDPSR